MSEDKCDIKRDVLETFTKNPKDRKKILNILEVCLVILSIGTACMMATAGGIYVYEWKKSKELNVGN